jgi:hypothetical protein
MSIDLQSVHCTLFSLHAHFPAGQPARTVLETTCGARFLKRRGTSEGRYSAAGRSYRIKLSVSRLLQGETVIDLTYDEAPGKPPKTEADFKVERLWKCLDDTLKFPTWHCRASFQYPPTGYNLKYRLPATLDRTMEGFSEIRGIRLARAVEGRTLYSVIVDRPDNEDIFCTLFFTMQVKKHEALSEDAFRTATDIMKLVVTAAEASGLQGA